MSTDSDTIVVGGADSNVHAFDLHQAAPGGEGVDAGASDGRRRAASTAAEREGEFRSSHTARVTAVAWSRDERFLLSADALGELTIWSSDPGSATTRRMSIVAEGEEEAQAEWVTQDLALHYLALGKSGPLETRARLLNRNRESALVRVEILDRGEGDRRVLAATLRVGAHDPSEI